MGEKDVHNQKFPSGVIRKISKNKTVKGAIHPVTAATSVCFTLCSLSIQDLSTLILALPSSSFWQPLPMPLELFASYHTTTPRYAAVFLMASTSFILGPLCHAQSGADVNSDTSRNIPIAICMFFGNIGSLVSKWYFLLMTRPIAQSAVA
ncbi:hypothetical protein LX32DRAFT_684360 [Colletotrichum zoysiae]|uniref:Uncharacterized protein n=1 Tax=Colletotrichum zoysiae TaxID=1216348 RepID=A0AAD9M2D6_9PEZI|nr:hypothetical protein LX32DRAFT_684360 [Colletotrichum zoysiae]